MRVRTLLGWLALALVCGSGCETTRNIKPPMPVDEVRDPPRNDERYNQPPSWPKGSLNQGGPPRATVETAPGPVGPNGRN